MLLIKVVVFDNNILVTLSKTSRYDSTAIKYRWITSSTASYGNWKYGKQLRSALRIFHKKNLKLHLKDQLYLRLIQSIENCVCLYNVVVPLS